MTTFSELPGDRELDIKITLMRDSEAVEFPHWTSDGTLALILFAEMPSGTVLLSYQTQGTAWTVAQSDGPGYWLNAHHGRAAALTICRAWEAIHESR